jgi:DNA-binding NarL/FixJ family response regulator
MKILLVEDHPIVISGCRRLFEEQADSILIEASTLADAREEFKTHRPDVIVVDVNLPDGSGLDLIREFATSNEGPKAIVFSMCDEPSVAKTAIDAGAVGFVSKVDRADALLDAVEAVSRGGTWLSDDLLQKLAFMRTTPDLEPPRLTRRQKNVLKRLAGGCRLSEIAAELNLSPKAVSADCAVMRNKLKARTNAEMLAIATKLDLN